MKRTASSGRPATPFLLLSSVLALVPAVLALAAVPAFAVGTPAMVKDINAGASSSTPQYLLPLGSKLFFVATNGTQGIEPWVSDGTLAGTTLIKDVWPGPSGGFNPGCATCNAISLGGVVYFSATDGTGGSQLWRTDGTGAGTTNVYPGTTASLLTAVGSKIFFLGGYFLCTSDGTTAGTGPVTTNTLPTGFEMIAINNIAYFTAEGSGLGAEVWRSDGTEGGTAILKDVALGSNTSYPQKLTKVGNRLFFIASDGTGPGGLYVSDGTTPGTLRLKTLSLGGSTAQPGQLIDANGTAYLIVNDSATGAELWKSDGTSAGTVLVKDIYPGNGGGLASSSLVAIGSTVYFAANDAVHGNELWKSDGTDAGTVMVKDIYPADGAFGSSSPAGLANVNGTLFFRAKSAAASGTQPWQSDGTDGGTSLIATLFPADNCLATGFLGVAGNIFFSATDGTQGVELWEMSAGVTGIPAGGGSSIPAALSHSYPNPSGPRTVIAFDLRSAARVSLQVYDSAGRLLRTLFADRALGLGRHEAAWDGRDAAGERVAQGVYVYRLTAGDHVESHRMVLAL